MTSRFQRLSHRNEPHVPAHQALPHPGPCNMGYINGQPDIYNLFLTYTGNPRSSKSSKILVCKPKRLIQNFTEFFEIKENYLNDLDDKNDSKLPPFVSKHHRVFYNSTTNLPQPYFAKNQPAAEDDIVPPWLKYITFIIHPKRRWPYLDRVGRTWSRGALPLHFFLKTSP